MKYPDLLKCHVAIVTAKYLYTVIVTSVLTVLLSFIAIFGNLLIIIAIARNKRIQSQSNILLGTLCLSDLLIGIIVQPIYVARGILEVLGKTNGPYCTLQNVHIFFAYFGVGASITTMAIVSVDRCLAICRPFLYREFQSKGKCLTIIAIDWSILLILMLTPYLGLRSVAIYIGASLVMVISITTIIACYISIYFVIIRHKRRISEQTVSQVEASDERSQRPQERRKTNTVAILIAVLFVCYVPHVACISYKSFSGQKIIIISKVVEAIILMNSSINPVIYCLRMSEIRSAVKDILRKVFCKSEDNGLSLDSRKHQMEGREISSKLSRGQ